MAKVTQAQASARLVNINFALADIKETLAIWRDDKPIHDPYMVKLWAEWDSLVIKKQRLLAVLG